ncbi:kinase-like domain-containing protein [Mycena vulgaris]|nr:kinase-like domain-containing protein [Mycena vulgaris]
MVPAAAGSAQTCGSASCLKSVTPAQGEESVSLGPSLVANAAFETNQHRAALMKDRMKKFSNNNPGTGLTTASLQSHENGGGAPGEPKIWICWQVRLSTQPKAIAAGLGYHAKGWAASLFLPDIKAEIVKVINTEWSSSGGRLPLLSTEVLFRWHGNRILDLGTQTMVLSDFYAYYGTPTNAPVYLQNVPTQWKTFERSRGTKPFVCLELFVKIDLYEERVASAQSLTSVRSTGSKRTRTQSSASASAQSNPKQPRLSVPLSEFNPSGRTRASVVQKWSPITFKKIKCITARADATTTLMEEEILRGRIFDLPFSSGTIKQAHDLIMSDGDQFVAKRFFRLRDDDTESVEVEDNKIQIQAELFRLAWGQWFLDGFYDYCRDREASELVDEALVFADAFLAEEVDAPSISSGVSTITEEDVGMTWLVERKRPTTVIKFSGTLVHTSARRDLCSLTICAFAHFVYGYGGGKIVFADLQGTQARVRGGDGLILFDLMTHTKGGNSGVSDFGNKGIATFVRDHECNMICSSLDLDTNYPLETEQTSAKINSRSSTEDKNDDDEFEEDELDDSGSS